jgi:signal transduction histidine kinase
MSHRFAIAAMWFSVLVLSFGSIYVKERLVTITCWLMFILHLWVIWIVYLNRFSFEYVAGLLTSFCALNTIVRKPALFYTFTSSAIVLMVFAGWLSPDPEIDFRIIAFTVVVIGAAFLVTSGAVITYQRELFLLNQSLEEKVAERTAEAENRAQQLAGKNRELEQFAYVASHDLKSPLRSIGSFVQLIQRKLKNNSNNELHEYLDFVVKAVVKMNAIIDDVLLYSRFGYEAAVFEKVEIQPVIQDACALLKREIQQKNAFLRFDVRVGKIPCDRRQVEQLFRNLVDNALKYNQSSRPLIEIAVMESNNEFLFSVKDNGIGIPPEFQDKIFKMFQRLHNDGEYPGTGVGLAVCKRIVENHHGKIWLQSGPGEGTTFFFTLGKNLGLVQRRKEMAGVLN